MSAQTVMEPQIPPRAGIFGFAIGALALIIVLVAFVGGPFAPQQTSAVTLGEIAGEASKATIRNWFGIEQPAPQVVAWTIDRMLWVAGVVLGAVAVLCGLLALVRRERRDLAVFAVSLGIGAITVQFLATAMMLLVGALIFCALIYVFGDFLNILG